MTVIKYIVEVEFASHSMYYDANSHKLFYDPVNATKCLNESTAERFIGRMSIKDAKKISVTELNMAKMKYNQHIS